jgi:hypothetical protein
MTGEVLTGGCLCGNVRYRVTAGPTWAGHCHCSLCRKATGAPYVSWFTVPTTTFELTAGFPAKFSSSPKANRQHCPSCGTQLTFQFNERPATIDVTIASLDNPSSVAPTENVHWGDRVDALLGAHNLPERKTSSA